MNISSIGVALKECVDAAPSRKFVKCGPGWLSFSEFNGRVASAAAGLVRLGLVRGDRVAILSANRIEVLDLIFACAHQGLVQVPLNAHLKGESLRHQIQDSEPKVVFADDCGLENLLDLDLSLSNVVSFDQVAASTESGRVGQVEVSGYLDILTDAHGVSPVQVNADDLAAILYTSGTTGASKGCRLTHGYYARVAAHMIYANGITREDVLTTPLPLFHGQAQMMVMSAALYAGASVVIEPHFDAHAFFTNARADGATLAYGVGAVADKLLKAPPSVHDKDHRLRLFLAAPLSPAAQRQFQDRFGCPVWAETYGLTECVPISNNPPFRSDHRLSSCGRPVDDVEVAILDDQGAVVPVASRGEVCVKPKVANAMFDGYWRNPKATKEAIVDGWFHTGDLGYQDEDGFVYFVDRKKNSIRRRGENISSAEVEAVIGKHADIDDVAVVGVPSQSTEEEIKACLVLREQAEVSLENLFEFFNKSLPYFAVPRFVEFLSELPKTATGRVQKFKLTAEAGSRDVIDLHERGLKAVPQRIRTQP